MFNTNKLALHFIVYMELKMYKYVSSWLEGPASLKQNDTNSFQKGPKWHLDSSVHVCHLSIQLCVSRDVCPPSWLAELRFTVCQWHNKYSLLPLGAQTAALAFLAHAHKHKHGWQRWHHRLVNLNHSELLYTRPITNTLMLLRLFLHSITFPSQFVDAHGNKWLAWLGFQFSNTLAWIIYPVDA